MTEGIRNYLLSVVSVALMAGILLALVPRGAVHRTLKFLCGLAVILAAMAPLSSFDPAQLALAELPQVLESEKAVYAAQFDSGETQVAAIIKEKAEAYIWDKARALGIAELSAEVDVATGGNYPYPCAARLTGDWDTAQRNRLTEIIANDLGIPAAQQEWYVEDER